MKKLVSICLVLALCLGLLAFGGCSAKNDDVAYLTVAIRGNLELIREPVALEDANEDGTITLDDLLTTAAADAGVSYVSEDTTFGPAIMDLWGDTSGAFGYYVNNDFVSSNLTMEVKAGDDAYVYSYQDTNSWTDCYSFFDKTTASVKAGESLELALTFIAYDANFQLVEAPMPGAVITVDGTDTEFTTDAEGKVTVILDQAGTCTLSAHADGMTLVPPVCVVDVK